MICYTLTQRPRENYVYARLTDYLLFKRDLHQPTQSVAFIRIHSGKYIYVYVCDICARARIEIRR